jgi:hypothetical protein
LNNAITNPILTGENDFGGPLDGSFSNLSGEFSIPPGYEMNIPVNFSVKSGFGTITGRLTIQWGNRQRNLALSGIITQVADLPFVN